MTRAIDYGPATHFGFGGEEHAVDLKMSSACSKNVPSKYLSDEENANVFRALGERCTSMALGMAQLMIAEGSRWSTVRIGVACYVRNYQRKIVTVAIVDPGYERRNPSVLTDINISPAVVFVPLTRSFLAFEADSTKYGINFAIVEEAQIFFQNVDVLQRRRLIQTKKKEEEDAGKSAVLTYTREDDQLASKSPSMHPETKAKKKKEKHSSFSFVDWFLPDAHTKKSKKKKSFNSNDISNPTNTKHTMHYGSDGSFLSKEGELDPTVSELYQHIHKDLEGDESDQLKNKKLLSEAVKRLGPDEVRKIVTETKARPPPPKIALPETPEIVETPVDVAKALNSNFSRGNRFSQGGDLDSPGIPLIHARNSIRVSKETYYKRNTVNAVKKYQTGRVNGSSPPNGAVSEISLIKPEKDVPAPLPARKESLLKPKPAPPPPAQNKKTPSSLPPLTPPPPLPSVAKPSVPSALSAPQSKPKPAPITSEPSALMSTAVAKGNSPSAPAAAPAPPPPPPPPPPPIEQMPKTPKSPTAQKNIPSEISSPNRANLMEEIRKGRELTKVKTGESSPIDESPSRSGNSIMDAISQKLNEMRPRIESDSEDEDESDDWDEN